MFELLVNAGEVNFTAIPQALQDKLLLPSLYSAEILASFILLFILLVPIAIFTRNFIVVIISIFLILFFEVAIGWIDGWIILIITMITSGLWTWNIFVKGLGD